MTTAKPAGPAGASPSRYHVGFSFAEPDRPYVAQVAAELRARGVLRHYDGDAESVVDLWGKHTTESLVEYYRDRFSLVVVFISKDYVGEDEARLQCRAALERAMTGRTEYILPARFDTTPVNGMLSSLACVDLCDKEPIAFAELVVMKLKNLGIIRAEEHRSGDLAAAELPECDATVRLAYRAVVAEATARFGLPTVERWNQTELGGARAAVEAHPVPWPAEIVKFADILSALCDAVTARPVMDAVGADRVRLDGLQQIYRRTLHRWPEHGESCDMIVVEAAHAAVVERRRTPGMALGALARFVLGVAAHTGAGMGTPLLADWIRSLGHQVADADTYLTRLADRPAWLLIDLGDEPLPPDGRLWPRTLTAQVRGKDLDIHDHETCVSRQDLVPALRRLLDRMVLPRRVFIDVAAPRALLDVGVEHLEVMQVDDGEYEPLAAGYRPRLRWSKRRTSRRMYDRLRLRADDALWHNGAILLPADHCTDRERLVGWLRRFPQHPVVLASAPGHAAAVDPLQVMLREGCGFLLWFPDGVDGETESQVAAAARQVPLAARKAELPDHLADVTARQAVIWDDPDGRGGFPLPPVVRLEAP